MINYLSTYLLLVFLVMNVTVSFAQKPRVESGEQAAVFGYTTDSSSTEPVIYYQQNVEMLSRMNDKKSLSIYGNGRVLVHYPVYMKKAGDYEMQLSSAELEDLLKSLSRNGIMDFDESKVKEKVDAVEKSLQAKGLFYDVSDAVVTNIDISLDKYQKNTASPMLNNFRKHFRWKNIEHDAKRHKSNGALVKANDSVSQLKRLMSDKRLVSKAAR